MLLLPFNIYTYNRLFQHSVSNTIINQFNPPPGIEYIQCFNWNDAIVDLTPVKIRHLDIYELDADRFNLGSMTFSDLADGDSVEYTSVLDEEGYAGEPVKALIIIIFFAANASGETLYFGQGFEFSNDCATYPVLTAGDTIGWYDLVSFPRQCGCGVQLSASVHPFLWCKPIYLILTDCFGICIIYFLFATF